MYRPSVPTAWTGEGQLRPPDLRRLRKGAQLLPAFRGVSGWGWGMFFSCGFFRAKNNKGGIHHIFPKQPRRKENTSHIFGLGKTQLFVEFFIYLYSKHPCKKRLGSWWFFKRFQKMHQGSAREVSATEPLHPTRRVLGGKMLGERLTFL